mmetsp:Transcript_50342/g.98669  ORF Transcript_50342/g.98669 Transcript_50342/m.98669 type:complete len:305 (+) Transcript_50342:26-940(+)
MESPLIHEYGGAASEEGVACRICLDEGMEGMIAPCRCKSDRKFVHRACLDNWRATKTGAGGRSFTHCEVCQFEYVVEVHDDEQLAKSRKRKFHALVARDSALVFLMLQLIIVALGALVHAMDTHSTLRNMFPELISKHWKTTYYICGLVVFLAILGLIGLCSLCICTDRSQTACNDSGCYYCYCGDCGDCKCDDAGGDGKECLVILVIIAVVLALIGIFVGIFLSTLLLQKIIQKHNRVLWLKVETQKFKVVDFNGKQLPPMASAPPSADVESGLLAPSAPPADQSDEMSFENPPQPKYPEGLF